MDRRLSEDDSRDHTFAFNNPELRQESEFEAKEDEDANRTARRSGHYIDVSGDAPTDSI